MIWQLLAPLRADDLSKEMGHGQGYLKDKMFSMTAAPMIFEKRLLPERMVASCFQVSSGSLLVMADKPSTIRWHVYAPVETL